MRTSYWCGVVAALLCLSAFAISSTTGFAPSAFADEDEKGDEPAPAPEEPKGDEGDEGESGTEGDGKPKVHKLYVPFKDLKDVFEKEGEGVFLPYDQFRKLWDRAYRVVPDNSTPPVAAAVRSAKYTGVATGEMIRFEAEVDVEVLAKGWQRVPLNFRGIGVEAATIDGEPALLVPTKEGYDLLLENPGRRTVDLVLRAGAPAKGDTHAAEFSLPPVPLARLSVEVPGGDTEVSITPRLASSTRVTATGKTELLAFLGPVSNVKLEWRRKPDDGPTIDPLVFASERVMVRVDRGVVRTTFRADLSILRAPLATFDVVVPDDAVVLYVQGDGIRTWVRSPANDKITVELREAAKEKYTVEIGLERPLPPTPVTITAPLAALDGMERESGFLRVQAAEGVKVEPRATPGLIQVDMQEMPKDLQAKLAGRAFSYRFPARPGEMTMQVDALEPRITAQVGNRVGIRPESLEVRTIANVRVERAGIFGVDFDLPAGLEITNLKVHGVDLDDYAQVDGTLRVTFRDRLLGATTITIDGRMRIAVPEEEGKGLDQEIPLPVLRGATHVRGYVAVHIESSLDRREIKKEGLTPLDSAAAAAVEPPPLQPTGEGPLPLVYRFEHREGALALTLGLERKDPTITASVATTARLEPDRTKLGATITYTVSFRGVDTFRFAAPLSLGERVHLGTTGMQLLDPVEEDRPEGAPDDWTPRGIWTVKLPAPRTGTIVVPLVIDDLPEDTLESGATRAVALPSFVPLDVGSEPLPNTVFFAAIQREALLRVDPDPDVVDKIEEIDARELPAHLRDPQTFLAFRSYDPEYRLGVRVTKHDYEEVAALVVSHMHLDTVVPIEGRATTDAYLTVRNNNVQFLELSLPRDAKLRAVRVAGTAETPRRGENGTVLIRLDTGRGKDEAFLVELVFDHEVERSGAMFETLTIASPEPMAAKSDILTWRVFVPIDREYTSFAGSVARIDAPRSWAGDLLATMSGAFATRPAGKRTDLNRLMHGYQSPFQTRHDGREFLFHGRVGTGTVEITGASPTFFAFWKFMWCIIAFVGAWLLAKSGAKFGFTPGYAFIAIVLVLLALLIPAGPGTAQVLSTMLYAVILAAVIHAALWWHKRRTAQRAARAAAKDAAPPSTPDAQDTPPDGGLPPDATPAPEGGAA